MSIRPLLALSLLLLPVLAGPSPAQDLGRVSPATVPLPLPTAAPMPPDRLRAQNPWNLAMTGPWRFKLTHGSIVLWRAPTAARQARRCSPAGKWPARAG